MKWAVIGVLTLGALGSWAMSLSAAGSLNGDIKPMPLPRVVMRPLPPLKPGPAAAPVVVAKRNEPPPMPAKVEPAPKPEVAPPKPEPVANPEPAPKPEVVAKLEPEAAKPAKEPKAKPPEEAAPREPKEPKAPKPSAEERETSGSAPSAPAPAGEGFINLKASDTAEIVVDGRKVGPSPKLNYKLKAGKHKIRFDCYDENGNLKPGKVQTVEIKPDEESTVDYECPVSQ